MLYLLTGINLWSQHLHNTLPSAIMAECKLVRYQFTKTLKLLIFSTKWVCLLFSKNKQVVNIVSCLYQWTLPSSWCNLLVHSKQLLISTVCWSSVGHCLCKWNVTSHSCLPPLLESLPHDSEPILVIRCINFIYMTTSVTFNSPAEKGM